MAHRDMALTEFLSSPDAVSDSGTYSLPWVEATVSYFIQKSTDAMDTGAKTEDTLAWKCSPGGEVMAFAVCDGVGGSYLGYVASQFLAEKLVFTMYNGAKASLPGAIPAPEYLRDLMNEWTGEAEVRIDEQPVSGNVNPFLAEVLRNRRRDGSHTVFFCGFLDFRPGGRSVFVWMGNVTGQAFDAQGRQLLDMRQMRDDRERWTTAHGCLGTPHIESVPTEQVRHVLVASDGLAAQFGQMALLHNKAADWGHLSGLGLSSYGDDASALSIWLPGGAINPLPNLPLIDLSNLYPSEKAAFQMTQLDAGQSDAPVAPAFALPVGDQAASMDRFIGSPAPPRSSSLFITKPDTAGHQPITEPQAQVSSDFPTVVHDPGMLPTRLDTSQAGSNHRLLGGQQAQNPSDFLMEAPPPPILVNADGRVSSVYAAAPIALKSDRRSMLVIAGAGMAAFGLVLLLAFVFRGLGGNLAATPVPGATASTATATATKTATPSTPTATIVLINLQEAPTVTPTVTSTRTLGGPSATPTEQATPPLAPTPELVNYTVQSNENLDGIAKVKCGGKITTDELCKINMSPGHELVKACDTLIDQQLIVLPVPPCDVN